MIIFQDGIKVGDLVYLSFTIYKESVKNKMTKKPDEHEFKVTEKTDHYIKLKSVVGEYELMFSNDTIESFFGTCRKS